MSFLNSVLSSIESKEQAHPQSSPLSKPRPNGIDEIRENTVSKREGTVRATTFQAPPSKKRRAEDELPRNEKILKSDQDTAPAPNGASSTQPQRLLPPDKVAKASVHTVPYRGTSRPSNSDALLPGKAPSKELKRPSITTSSSAQPGLNRATIKSPNPTTPTTTAPLTPSTPAAEGTKVPKKGSYAEIMARAKLVQNSPPVGVIKHQPKDKKALSDKKELLLQKKGLSGKPKPAPKDGHNRTSSGDVSGGSRPGSAGKSEGPAKKKAPEIAYKGTAKPKPQPTYKGTMKPASSPALPTHKKSFAKQDDRSRSNSISRPLPAKTRRRGYSEGDEDEEEEEDEEDFESGSDMEAGYSDVEEEESKATKIAKKEDEFEARMEAEMKRQKEARKKRDAEIARNQKRNQY